MTVETAPLLETASPARPVNRLSPEVIDQVDRLLDAAGIFHDTLVEGRPRLNHNVSDRSHVFAKVSRVGELTARPFTEVQGARLAAQHGIAGPRLLIDEPQILHTPDGDRAVTVWSWFDGCSAPALRDQVLEVLGVLATMAAAPVPAVPAVDVRWFADRVENRLAGRYDSTSTRIRGQARESFARILAALDPSRYGWVHGDAHLRNVMWGTNGRPVLVDWESHGRCAIEWEIAPLLRSVFVDTPDYSADERLRVARLLVAKATDMFDPDWHLVMAVLRARNASAESHLYLMGHDPAGLAACSSLDALTEEDAAFLASLGAPA